MSDGFVADFKAYLSGRTDCPPDFFVPAALTCLSIALGHGVWCDGWTRPIYPNLWSVIIAPSGYGKSAPLDLAEMLLERAGFGERLYPESFSQEALMHAIKARPEGGFILQELTAFMGVLGREYNAGMRDWLTSIYDVPAVTRRLLRQDSIAIEKPTVSILAATNPAWFAERFKEDDLRGGFFARAMFFPSATPGPYVGPPGPHDDRRLDALADHLRMAADLAGHFSIDPVRKRLDQWDRARRTRVREDCPPEFAGMRSRATMLVLKAAMLFHVAREPRTRVIEPDDIEQAIRYVEYAQRAAERFLTEDVARNSQESERLRILEIVARRGGRVGHSDALRLSHLDAAPFGRAVRTLIEAGQLVVEKGRGKVYAVPLPAFDSQTIRPDSQSSREPGRNGRYAPASMARDASGGEDGGPRGM